MEEKEIFINGLKINYKIAGEGPAILVLHGWGGSSESWFEFQQLLANKGYRVIVPDLPGFGKSITPPLPWDVQNYMEFVLKLIGEIGVDSFYLLGHSFGGRISIKFAVQYPEKIKSLILCSSAGIKPKPGLKTRMIFWAAKIGNAVLTPKHLTRFKDSIQNLFYNFIRNKDYARAKGTMRETIKRVLAEDLLLELPKINKRTLLIWGDADKMVPVKYAYIFQKNIKDSKLEILPKIGHSPHLEVPRDLSQLIINFITD